MNESCLGNYEALVAEAGKFHGHVCNGIAIGTRMTMSGLRRIGITATRSRSETPEAWWVRIPPQRNRSEAERRVVELNLLGVSDTFIVQESGPNQNAVSLGLFKTENRARILLGQLRAKGVENAGIEPRMATSYRIQASVPANELRIVESAAPGLRARRQACTR